MVAIACLGWGSLVWNPGDLPVAGAWREDGPWLPLEFARTSDNGAGRLTLVIAPGVVASRSLWALLVAPDLATAKALLRARERCASSAIGQWPSAGAHELPAYAEIDEWAKNLALDGVVWTALPAKFRGVSGSAPNSAAEAVGYLRQLPDAVLLEAEEYVRRAPRQIRSPFRDAFEHQLGWTPV
jgi:hypothetical protein